MPWVVIASALVSAYAGSGSAKPHAVREPDFEQQMRERRQRIEIETRETLRDGMVGAALLIALALTAAYGAAQLLGVV